MNRYDFVFVFDVKNANPNGDPDAGNMPRIDPETGIGVVTDVCLKRKIRNYVDMTRSDKSSDKNDDRNGKGYRIYFREGVVLNKQNEEAWTDAGLNPSADLKDAKGKVNDLTTYMCRNFYDIRTFGAVMTTGVNCGQVRGPVQLSFANSLDPIVIAEHAITRSSVTNEKDKDKERTMGRKYTIPYALYVAYGFVNPFLAEKYNFDDDDLKLLWEALTRAFDFDQSAARPAGSMVVRKLIVFKHENKLGNAPSHKLFERVKIVLLDRNKPPREFADYAITIDKENWPDGVELEEKI